MDELDLRAPSPAVLCRLHREICSDAGSERLAACRKLFVSILACPGFSAADVHSASCILAALCRSARNAADWQASLEVLRCFAAAAPSWCIAASAASVDDCAREEMDVQQCRETFVFNAFADAMDVMQLLYLKWSKLDGAAAPSPRCVQLVQCCTSVAEQALLLCCTIAASSSSASQLNAASPCLSLVLDAVAIFGSQIMRPSSSSVPHAALLLGRLVERHCALSCAGQQVTDLTVLMLAILNDQALDMKTPSLAMAENRVLEATLRCIPISKRGIVQGPDGALFDQVLSALHAHDAAPARPRLPSVKQGHSAAVVTGISCASDINLTQTPPNGSAAPLLLDWSDETAVLAFLNEFESLSRDESHLSDLSVTSVHALCAFLLHPSPSVQLQCASAIRSVCQPGRCSASMVECVPLVQHCISSLGCPEVTASLCNTLPLLAVRRENLTQVLGCIRSLLPSSHNEPGQKSTGACATGLRVLCALWQVQDCVFPLLHAELEVCGNILDARLDRKGSEDASLRLSVAATLKVVCDCKPSRGIDILPIALRILQRDSATSCPFVTAHCLDCLRHLISQGFLPFTQTWQWVSKQCSHAIQRTAHVAVTTSIVELVALSANLKQLGVSGVDMEEHCRPYMRTLWALATHTDGKVRARAFAALSNFPAPLLVSSVPDVAKSNGGDNESIITWSSQLLQDILSEQNVDAKTAGCACVIHAAQEEASQRKYTTLVSSPRNVTQRVQQDAFQAMNAQGDRIALRLKDAWADSNNGSMGSSANLSMVWAYRCQDTPAQGGKKHSAKVAQASRDHAVRLTSDLVSDCSFFTDWMLRVISLNGWCTFCQQVSRAATGASTTEAQSLPEAHQAAVKPVLEELLHVLPFRLPSVGESSDTTPSSSQSTSGPTTQGNACLALASMCCCWPEEQGVAVKREVLDALLTSACTAASGETLQYSAIMGVGMCALGAHPSDQQQCCDQVFAALQACSESPPGQWIRFASAISAGLVCQARAKSDIWMRRSSSALEPSGSKGGGGSSLTRMVSWILSACGPPMQHLIPNPDQFPPSAAADDFWTVVGAYLGLSHACWALSEVGGFDTLLIGMYETVSAILSQKGSAAQHAASTVTGCALLLPVLLSRMFHLNLNACSDGSGSFDGQAIIGLADSLKQWAAGAVQPAGASDQQNTVQMVACASLGSVCFTSCLNNHTLLAVKDGSLASSFTDAFTFLSALEQQANAAVSTRSGCVIGMANLLGCNMLIASSCTATGAVSSCHASNINSLWNIPLPSSSSENSEEQPRSASSAILERLELLSGPDQPSKLSRSAVCALSMLSKTIFLRDSVQAVSSGSAEPSSKFLKLVALPKTSVVRLLVEMVLPMVPSMAADEPNASADVEVEEYHVNLLSTLQRACPAQLPDIDWSTLFAAMHSRAATAQLRRDVLQASFELAVSIGGRCRLFLERFLDVSYFRSALDKQLQMAVIKSLPGLFNVFSPARIAAFILDMSSFICGVDNRSLPVESWLDTVSQCLRLQKESAASLDHVIVSALQDTVLAAFNQSFSGSDSVVMHTTPTLRSIARCAKSCSEATVNALVSFNDDDARDPCFSPTSGLRVGSLGIGVNRSHLQSMFECFGEIESVVIMDPKTETQKQTLGFVNFFKHDHALKAFSVMSADPARGSLSYETATGQTDTCILTVKDKPRPSKVHYDPLKAAYMRGLLVVHNVVPISYLKALRSSILGSSVFLRNHPQQCAQLIPIAVMAVPADEGSRWLTDAIDLLSFRPSRVAAHYLAALCVRLGCDADWGLLGEHALLEAQARRLCPIALVCLLKRPAYANIKPFTIAARIMATMTKLANHSDPLVPRLLASAIVVLSRHGLIQEGPEGTTARDGARLAASLLS